MSDRVLGARPGAPMKGKCSRCNGDKLTQLPGGALHCNACGLTLGSCYQSALLYLEARPDQPGLRLIHAAVLGTAGDTLGQWYGHAWVERRVRLPWGTRRVVRDAPTLELLRREAIDVGLGEKEPIPAVLYRGIGNARDVHEYTLFQAALLAVRHGHYGPWHEGAL
jgi:hypothetical protein